MNLGRGVSALHSVLVFDTLRELSASGSSLKLKTAPQRKIFKKWQNFVAQTVRDTPPTLLHALYQSMPRRRKAIIKAKGGCTKY